MTGERGGARSAGSQPRPTWQRLSDTPRCIVHRPNLARTVSTALVVGTVLFAINHLAAVLRGRAGTGTWVATGLSFVVPFIVANIGLLFASRQPPTHPPPPGDHHAPAPTWRRLRECPRCVVHRPHLARTATTALVVGTIYLVVNHYHAVVSGQATDATWAASGLTYLVPFSVANVGLLVGCRRHDDARPAGETAFPAASSAAPARRPGDGVPESPGDGVPERPGRGVPERPGRVD